MNTTLDRAEQRRWLEKLADQFPEDVDVQSDDDEVRHRTVVNLLYLEQHGLVQTMKAGTLRNPTILITAKITADGLDFLADDGGLRAILGVVTVKLHADTVRELIMARVEQSALPEPEKAMWRKKLGTVTDEALKDATKRLMEAALNRLPDVLPMLQTIFGF